VCVCLSVCVCVCLGCLLVRQCAFSWEIQGKQNMYFFLEIGITFFFFFLTSCASSESWITLALVIYILAAPCHVWVMPGLFQLHHYDGITLSPFTLKSTLPKALKQIVLRAFPWVLFELNQLGAGHMFTICMSTCQRFVKEREKDIFF
jgi:hypothetical protein